MDRRQFSKAALLGAGAVLGGVPHRVFAQARKGFLDARRMPLPETIRGKVCIVGAGAAGLTLAREMAKTTDGIILVEAGGIDIDGQTQGLYAGRNLGLSYHNLLATRLRYFGGTTNHWGGYCRANDPIDYEGRAALNLPAWPFGSDDLAPYVSTAGEALGVRSEHFDPAAALRDKGLSAVDLPDGRSDIILTKLFQLAPVKLLGPEYQDEIANTPAITTYTNLNLTHIQLNPAGTAVQHLDCATLDGTRTRIEADQIVLCCHAIENARLLMTSDDVQTGGIGNGSDHVGRYFMDHIYIKASRFRPSETFPRLYDARYLRRLGLNANPSFTDAYLREANLLQYYCRFTPRFVSDETRDAMSDLRRSVMRPGDLDFLQDIGQVVSELVPALRSSSRRFRDYVQPEFFSLEHRLEQAPNPDSRVVVSDRTDALGQRIADLDWRMHDLDIEAFQRGQQLMADEMTRLGYGVLEPEEITRELVEERVTGHYHHIGTTRMSQTAADGVVDANCKVHGVDNLYVGGSSTFPTAGYSGPTMMIMAMSLRLAEHLGERV